MMCVLVEIYVKNAFNTLRWHNILLEAEERRMPQRFMRLLRSYLEDRKLTIHNEDETIERGMYAGVPQGSSLGSLLWIIVYDGLLRDLQTVKNLNPVTFADDLALIITTKRQKEIKNRLCEAMGTVIRWCTETGLRLA